MQRSLLIPIRTSSLSISAALIRAGLSTSLCRGLPRSVHLRLFASHPRSDTGVPAGNTGQNTQGDLPRFFSHKHLPLVAGTSVLLSEEESRHATKALRLGQDAEVEVFDGEGVLGEGRLQVSKRQTNVFLDSVRQVANSSVALHSLACWHSV